MVKKPNSNKTLMTWVFLLLAALFISNFAGKFAENLDVKEVAYSEILKNLEKNNIKSVTFEGDQVKATLKASGDEKKNTLLVSPLPPLENPDLLRRLEIKEVEIKAKSNSSGQWTSILIGFLPWIFILGFFYFSTRNINKKMGGGGMGRPPFMGGDKKFEITEKVEVTFDNVAGSENAKTDLKEIVDFLKTPERFNQMGAQLPRGVLMVGPPGTGKTLMAKAVAGEAGVPFFSLSGSEFIELYVGMGASRVRKLFSEAKAKAPAIIFIDEIDSIGRSRGTGLGGGHDEREQTLNQILAEMDGFGTGESVVVLAATNRPDVLDSALTRPGRFDRQVTMDLPMVKSREAILEIHSKKVPLHEEVNLNEIAKSTPGFSGAELKNLVNEATLLAARKKQDKVKQQHFSEARDKVLMGNPRDEHLSDEQKKVIAVHESGHALVALLSPHSNPVTKITIIPRGRALGFTEQTPLEDQVNHTKSYLLTQIAILLGGRMAEKIVVGDITTGAQDDLKRATKMARSMVANFGMSETFGLLSLDLDSTHPFLGKEMGKSRDFSEETARKVDEEVLSILKEREEYVMDLLNKNIDKLKALTDKVFEEETLDQAQIENCLS